VDTRSHGSGALDAALVDSTLFEALRTGASDIHLETGPAGMVIQYRLDGVPEVFKQADELDIAQRRIP